MRVVVVGATGTIGRAVVEALKDHDVIALSRHSSPVAVDITDRQSVAAMYQQISGIDAVICAAGSARFKPLEQLSDDDFAFSMANKLMGQVHVVLAGLAHLNDKGSFTLTSGILAKNPMPGSGAISLVNAGLEGFARAAALEAPRGIRVNIVSPPWVTETLQAMGLETKEGLPAATVACAYLESVNGAQTGIVIEPQP